MAQVKVTITYDYGGDYDTNEEAIADELRLWTTGSMDLMLYEIAENHTLGVEIIGDVSDEDIEDEDEDDEKAA